MAVSDPKTPGIAENAMDQVTNVYIWDMDETLILLKSLLNGTYAEAFNGLKDVEKGVEIGRMWEDQILKICDDCFFYEQVSLHISFKAFLFCFSNLQIVKFIFSK